MGGDGADNVDIENNEGALLEVNPRVRADEEGNGVHCMIVEIVNAQILPKTRPQKLNEFLLQFRVEIVLLRVALRRSR